jgi:AraC-like DNA-binding protein
MATLTGGPEISPIELINAGSISIAKIKVTVPERAVRLHITGLKNTERRLSFVLQLSGTVTYEQGNRAIQLSTGQWEAFDSSPLRMRAGSPNAEQIIGIIPHALLDSGAESIETRLQRVSAPSGLSRLACQAATCLIEELPRSDVRRAEDLAEALCHVLRAAIRERFDHESSYPSPLERARQRAKQCVDHYLRDPLLSVDAIAARLNCTTRYLQKAFQESGQTLRDYIWHQRLSCCYRDLTDPTLSDRNITEIAMSWGFNSVTHFSDAFRKRFGISPRAARRKWAEPSCTAEIPQGARIGV